MEQVRVLNWGGSYDQRGKETTGEETDKPSWYTKGGLLRLIGNGHVKGVRSLVRIQLLPEDNPEGRG